MDPTALPTFQNLPAHLREPFLRAVRGNPLQWLLPPYTDDEFDSSEQCLARLQAFALGQGFAVVTGEVNRDRTLLHYQLDSQIPSQKRPGVSEIPMPR